MLRGDHHTIVLATGNPHKVQELHAVFDGTGSSPFVIRGLADLPGHDHLREPEEPGATCQENARIKAISYARQIAALPGPGLDASTRRRVLILADDSGIEIDALALPDGTPRPGVISSHYATDGRETGLPRERRDAANNARVLRELGGVASERRTARFVCCMCLVRFGEAPDPSGDPAMLHETRGVMDGRIGIPPRVPSGDQGFGYDPLFLVAAAPHDFARTGAEVTSGEKNRLSHRGMAARAMVAWIELHARSLAARR